MQATAQVQLIPNAVTGTTMPITIITFKEIFTNLKKILTALCEVQTTTVAPFYAVLGITKTILEEHACKNWQTMLVYSTVVRV